MLGISEDRRVNLGTFIVDTRGTVIGFDDAMERMTGWPAAQVVGQSKDLLHPIGIDGTQVTTSRPLYPGKVEGAESPTTRRLILYCRDGGSIETEVMVSKMIGPGERLRVTLLEVVSRSARTAKSTLTPDCHDPLTGLPGRESFFESLAIEFRMAASTSRPLALLVLDIDHLRKVNDRFGAAAGDDVLKKIAGILRVAVEPDLRLARIGADDFAVLLPNAGRGDARQFAARLRSTVERFRFLEGPEQTDVGVPNVTVSVGAASFPADADSERDLFDRAIDALKEARTLGRNRVWCYMRRPRVPLEVPVYFDGTDPLLVGYTRDLSPSGIFVQTAEPIEVGMRCALTFPLPGRDNRVHVVGRVVRSVFPPDAGEQPRVPGIGVEFERFTGGTDQRAIDLYLHGHQSETLRPEDGAWSV